MTVARTIVFKLNGATVTADVRPHHNVVEILQTLFGLTGARESCGQGLCGCCTVLVDGRAVSGCLYLASFLDGAEVTTVESLEMTIGSVSCRRPSSKRRPFNAATARPGSS
jgi:aerobic-type carbon monoxide dehydrogenase small subunit (CoxS/CutS family)